MHSKQSINNRNNSGCVGTTQARKLHHCGQMHENISLRRVFICTGGMLEPIVVAAEADRCDIPPTLRTLCRHISLARLIPSALR
jgi:hypothetical protein